MDMMGVSGAASISTSPSSRRTFTATMTGTMTLNSSKQTFAASTICSLAKEKNFILMYLGLRNVFLSFANVKRRHGVEG